MILKYGYGLYPSSIASMLTFTFQGNVRQFGFYPLVQVSCKEAFPILTNKDDMPSRENLQGDFVVYLVIFGTIFLYIFR